MFPFYITTLPFTKIRVPWIRFRRPLQKEETTPQQVSVKQPECTQEPERVTDPLTEATPEAAAPEATPEAAAPEAAHEAAAPEAAAPEAAAPEAAHEEASDADIEVVSEAAPEPEPVHYPFSPRMNPLRTPPKKSIYERYLEEEQEKIDRKRNIDVTVLAIIAVVYISAWFIR